jgi:hypothetical protein
MPKAARVGPVRPNEAEEKYCQTGILEAPGPRSSRH